MGADPRSPGPGRRWVADLVSRHLRYRRPGLRHQTVFLCLAAPGLRTPLAVPCSYPSPFGMVPHPGINGELSGAGAAYTGLHNISPQMSAVAAAAVAAYGRTQVVLKHTQNSLKCP